MNGILEMDSIRLKLKEHMSFTFFIFYSRTAEQTPLEKLSFKLKSLKRVDLYFCDFTSEAEVEESLLTIKTLEPTKLKIIFFGYESNLLHLLRVAHQYGVDLNGVPFAIYTQGFHNDLSAVLGWVHSERSILNRSLSEYEQLVDVWMSSPQEKIDVWDVSIRVNSEDGHIFKCNAVEQIEYHCRELKEQFVSHFSIGYHSKLAMGYEHNRKSNSSTLVNRFIYGLESFKQFCCIGQPNVQSTTGVVSIHFKDQEDNQMEILKEFREYEEGEEELARNSRLANRRILTLLFTNIDRYHGERISLKHSKFSDNKLEFISFESATTSHEVGKVNGNVQLILNSDEVYIQVGNNCFKLTKPEQIVIRHCKTIRVMINKQSLEF